MDIQEMGIRTGAIETRNGSVSTARSDIFGRLITLSQGGSLFTACNEGRLFAAANQAAVNTTAGLATTWTGLGLCNPSGSGVMVAVHEFSWAMSVVGSDDGAVGLMTADSTGMASAITARNRKFGGPASKIYVDDGASIGTPVLEQLCGTHGMGATTTQISAGPHVINLKGGLILLPGRSVLTYTTTATTTCMLFGFIWEEIPIV